MEIKIEKNIPVAVSRKYIPKNVGDMGIGDSFLVKEELFEEERDKVRVNIINKLRYYNETKNWKFKTKSCDGGLRVWRIK